MNLIVAVTKDYAIGKNNDMLFHLKKDLSYYKEKTLNKVVVMGKHTYFSIPNRPLKNRINVVLTTDYNFKEEGIVVVHNFNELFNFLKNYNTDDIFISGGATLYNKLLNYCNFAYVTEIDAIKEADTFITNISQNKNFKEIFSSENICENRINYKFKVYKNKNPQNLDNFLEFTK